MTPQQQDDFNNVIAAIQAEKISCFDRVAHLMNLSPAELKAQGFTDFHAAMGFTFEASERRINMLFQGHLNKYYSTNTKEEKK